MEAVRSQDGVGWGGHRHEAVGERLDRSTGSKEVVANGALLFSCNVAGGTREAICRCFALDGSPREGFAPEKAWRCSCCPPMLSTSSQTVPDVTDELTELSSLRLALHQGQNVRWLHDLSRVSSQAALDLAAKLKQRCFNLQLAHML